MRVSGALVWFMMAALVLPMVVGAEGRSFQWGGRGYDPALRNRSTSARFSLKPHYDYSESEPEAKNPPIDPALVDLWVDAKETVNEIGTMQLASQEERADSVQCWKAMRHISAPWACSFSVEDVRSLKGQGTISVFDRSDKVLLQEPSDLDALNAFLDELLGEEQPQPADQSLPE